MLDPSAHERKEKIFKLAKLSRVGGAGAEGADVCGRPKAAVAVSKT
jgi:hypothetical protein